MINKNFNKRCFAHVHLLNVTMSRCHCHFSCCSLIMMARWQSQW